MYNFGTYYYSSTKDHKKLLRTW